MDTVTQGLLGAVIAQCGFRQKIGPAATWLAAAAAVMPDLDILLDPLATLTGAEHTTFDMYVTHRGESHSLILIPFFSLVFAAIWWWFARKKQPAAFWPRYFCIVLAMLSAPLLDLFTAWGTQLFAPFSNARFALDAVPIVDFIYSPILIVTLIICLFARKLKRDSNKFTFITGLVGLSLSTAYLFAGLVTHEIIISKAREHFGNGSARYEAYPQIPTIFVWRVVRFDGDQWMTGRLNILYGLDMNDRHWQFAPQKENEWIELAREKREIRIFNWFTDGMMRSSYSTEDSLHIAEFHDMRYGLRPESVKSLWGAAVYFDHDGTLIDIKDVKHYRDSEVGDPAAAMFKDIFRK